MPPSMFEQVGRFLDKGVEKASEVMGEAATKATEAAKATAEAGRAVVTTWGSPGPRENNAAPSDELAEAIAHAERWKQMYEQTQKAAEEGVAEHRKIIQRQQGLAETDHSAIRSILAKLGPEKPSDLLIWAGKDYSISELKADLQRIVGERA